MISSDFRSMMNFTEFVERRLVVVSRHDERGACSSKVCSSVVLFREATVQFCQKHTRFIRTPKKEKKLFNFLLNPCQEQITDGYHVVVHHAAAHGEEPRHGKRNVLG
jgi:hypothetical protein